MSDGIAWTALKKIMKLSKEPDVYDIAKQAFMTFGREDRTDQFHSLRAANAARDKIWDPEGKLTPLFRSTEFGEEAGEVLGVVKKLERAAMGLKGSRKTIGDLQSEVGDVMITLDLLCMTYDIDIWEATKTSFNNKSKEHGFEVFL